MQKVSLLITTYNVREHLTATLESIQAQDYAPMEVVIVDGGSTDGTADIIREFAVQYPDAGKIGDMQGESTGADNSAPISVRWISEPDSGLYDAMNKAWSMCSGDIVAVCNDKLCTPDAVGRLVRAIEQGGDGCIGAHSDLVYMDGERVVRSWHMGEGRLADGWMPGHPTLFLKRQIYEKYGVYDISYRCAADYEFMVRFLKDEENRLAYVPEVLVSMFYGGTSNAGLGNYLISFKEGYLALKRNKVPHPLLITIKRTFRVLRQFRERR